MKMGKIRRARNLNTRVQKPEHGAKKAKKRGPEGVRAVQSTQQLQLMTSTMKAVADGLFGINKAGDEFGVYT